MTQSSTVFRHMVFALMLLVLAAPSVSAGEIPWGASRIESSLADRMATGRTEGYIISFTGRADLTQAYAMEWTEQGRFVVSELQRTARESQARVSAYLQSRRTGSKSFWIANVIVVHNSDFTTLEGLKTFGEIASIKPLKTWILYEPVARAQADDSINAAESNLVRVKAPQVWQSGVRGSGIVVGNIDTGVLYTHTALKKQYRGCTNTPTCSSYNHNYNWFDPYGDSPSSPVDTNGHGTHTMGIMVGDDGAGNQIGMAPSAQWIACRGCNSSSCSGTALLECAQWIAAPTDTGGNNPDPGKRPHVINNSWGDCEASYDDWYRTVVDNWVAAGIYPVFSNGNAGNCGYPYPPGCNTVGNPGRYGNVTGVGSSTKSSGAYATHSNWGPTDNPDTVNPVEFPTLKPQVVAPGVDIRSSYNSSVSSYTSMTGTSMSAPHVSGLIALMWEGAPCLVRDYPATESIIMDTAVAIPYATSCGGEGPDNLPNMATGWGEIDAFAALQKAKDYCGVTTAGIQIARTGTGSGAVKSYPAGINCGASCFYDFGPSKTVRLTATPSSNSLFTGWSGACSGTSRTCTVVTNGGLQNVSAGFSSDPNIAVTPSYLPFTSVKIGFNTSKFLYIRNNGKNDLSIGAITSSSSQFTVPVMLDNCSGRVLPPFRGSCSVKIEFWPTVREPQEEILTIPSNDPDTPELAVPMKGTGL